MTLYLFRSSQYNYKLELSDQIDLSIIEQPKGHNGMTLQCYWSSRGIIFIVFVYDVLQLYLVLCSIDWLLVPVIAAVSIVWPGALPIASTFSRVQCHSPVSQSVHVHQLSAGHHFEEGLDFWQTPGSTHIHTHNYVLSLSFPLAPERVQNQEKVSTPCSTALSGSWASFHS